MGQYRLALYFRLYQIGFSIWYQKKYSIDINIMFVTICIGLCKNAKGVHFGKD